MKAGDTTIGELVGTAQAVAGGAVLAVVSIAMAPHDFSEGNRPAATATAAGFLAGYLPSCPRPSGNPGRPK